MTTVSLITVISMAVYVGATGAFFNDNEQVYGDSLGFQWGLINLTEDFENTADWDAQWDENGTTTWTNSSVRKHSGSWAALTNNTNKGYLTSDEIDASSASSITISFWYRPTSIETGDVIVESFNGTSWNPLTDIRSISNFSNNSWRQYSTVITDPQYLIPGFKLRFNSSGINEGNDILYIDDIGIITDNTPPAQPLGLTATAGDTEITLHWTANNETDLSGYTISRSTNGIDYTIIESNYSSSNYTDTGLTNNVQYYYKINAVDFAGNTSIDSATASATPSNQPPAAPTGLTAAPGNRVIYLDWNNNTDSDLAGYNLYRSLTAGSGYTQINGTLIPAGTINFTDSAVSANVTYYYVVKAVDTTPYESADSNEASAVPDDYAPAAPTGLSATGGSGQISLSWNAVPEDDVVGYNVYRSSTNGTGYSRITPTPVGTPGFTDTGLGDGQTYYYVVTAIDTAGNESVVSNEVYATTQTAVDIPLTVIGAVSGNTTVGFTLAAGPVSPAGAYVTYQWQSGPSANGTFTDITGADSSVYTLVSTDSGTYIRVTATGYNGYTGTVISDAVGPVITSPTLITAIDNIIGSPIVGATLTAGALTPYGATATWQWLRCETFDGTYEIIAGANMSTYTISSEDYGYFFKVTAAGTGIYTGTVTSPPTVQVAAGVLTGIAEIIGTTEPGEILTAGQVFPVGATVTYQWQMIAQDGTVENITGATAQTFLLSGAQNNAFMRVIAYGVGSYTGTVVSALTKSRVTSTIIPLAGLTDIVGTPAIGSTLHVGALTPEDATATFQWQRCTTANGTCENITGANFITYTLTPADYGSYLRVVATGSGAYTGILYSATTGPVTAGTIISISNIVGSTVVDQTLYAGSITPAGATVSYRWQRSTSIGGLYSDIPDATTNLYTITANDTGYYFRVIATGTGAYSGSATSAATGPATSVSIPITAIGNISGTLNIGSTLSAGLLTPSGATVTWQWKKSGTAGGYYDTIQGATSSTYIIQPGDLGYYFKVVATGSGTYTGTVTSAATGQVTAAPLESVSNIIGTTAEDQTVYAGTVYPLGATVYYQWQISDSGNPSLYTDIPGATENAFHFLRQDYNTLYIRLKVTGYGSYAGTVYSNPAGPVTTSVTPMVAIGDIIGTARVGQTLTAGVLNPAGASVTYQWQRSSTVNGTYQNIAGSVSSTYTLTPSDFNLYVRVVATGSGAYSGVVISNPTGQVTAWPITSVGSIIGTTTVGQTLTAGPVTPSGATVSWQWQRNLTAGGTFTDIPGETAGTYILQSGDTGYYFKVKATGTGAYSGTATSAATGPVVENSTAVTGIENITGTAQVGMTLTAGALTPSAATVTWQWQRCDSVDGAYQNIDGATSNTYTIIPGDFGKYIKVVATGSGSYAGTVTSNATSQISAGAITGIADIMGTTSVGYTITAGAVTPAGATVTYQWQASESGSPTNFTDITGATASTYYFQWGTYVNKYLRVVVTGYGSYTGTVSSNPAGPVTSSSTPVTAIGDITGTTTVGQTLTAGTLTPTGASATYQWLRCTTANGTYEPITGYYTSTYTLAAGDLGYYIKVEATGSGTYSGVVTSNPTGQVTAAVVTAIGSVSGTTQVGQTLTSGALTPAAATVSYQWQKAETANGTYVDISGATSNTYIIESFDSGYYIRVTATGTGSYTGTVTSAVTGPVAESTTPVTGISITGTARVAETLTAGNLTPSGATVSWQWQRSETSDFASYQNISGATSSTYTLTAGDYKQYVRVVVTGSGTYSGSAASNNVGPIAKGLITGITNIIGEPNVGTTLVAGTVSPSGATVTYQWQYSDWGGTVWTNIPGATASTYYIANLQYRPGYIRVIVTGTGAFEGTATSARTTLRVGGGS
jgi:fibronectin type 3 domain-containing protein